MSTSEATIRATGRSAPSPDVVLVRQCRGCGRPEDDWFTILEMDPMPLAGQFCDSRAEAELAGRVRLTWVQCRWCELVQVLEDVSDDVLFSQYRYGSSSVPGLVRHFEAYAEFLIDRFGRDGVRAVEIGANDGVLLSRLPETWELTGIDPSDVASKQRSGTYELLNAPFTLELVESHPELRNLDLVTSSNAMAHFTDLQGAIRAAHLLLKEDGELILEVHDLEATLHGGQWDTVYHEHKVEWSERSLRACVEEAGFETVFVQRLELHGGLLRCGFRRRSAQRRPLRRRPLTLAPFRTLIDGYRDRRGSETAVTLMGAQADGQRLVAYGASGRANVWVNQMLDLRFDYIVDDAPLRTGRWLPHVAIPIVPSDRFDRDQPDVCLVTAWNYAADIRAKHPAFSGRWVQTFNLGRDPA